MIGFMHNILNVQNSSFISKTMKMVTTPKLSCSLGKWNMSDRKVSTFYFK